MTCPRCDSTLERYALDGETALACRACGYLGVTVEHRSERRERESWEAALARFRRGG
ncbi:hypothetical protein ACFQPA_05640 [Halomarina halobia]|uniref:Transcription factor zinc-finger domain-containing protein n=1 Tax=Halomarina halobia TaxID=3033386 RepID=A0ABD6A695_9EURY|nr:hypothetical protein [Halomarina sp. PSR21]